MLMYVTYMVQMMWTMINSNSYEILLTFSLMAATKYNLNTVCIYTLLLTLTMGLIIRYIVIPHKVGYVFTTLKRPNINETMVTNNNKTSHL